MASEIDSIISKSSSELESLGNKAKEFIFNNKTADNQVRIIVKMLEELHNYEGI